MKHKFILLQITVLLCLFDAGCASTGNVTMSQPLSMKLSQFKSATVEVKSSMSKAPNRLDEFMVQLESRIIAKLRAQKTFEKIYSQAETDSHADLRVTVTITRIRDLDNFDRLMWGALAGQAKTEATVELREQATGKLIGAGRIEGKSSNGTVLSGTTPEAVDRVADEVVNLIKKNS
ncbi:MAG TPA: DUF4410 domain-containing protein [Verrucomicrobiae bacterium]|jgi:hypothetical protein|nr:DUF4410 domain-containing protein [Verrucomicrobiae bacterium]